MYRLDCDMSDDLIAGFFGEWHKRMGHGEVVHWAREDNGYRLEMIMDGDEPQLPRTATLMQFAVQVCHGMEQGKWLCAGADRRW